MFDLSLWFRKSWVGFVIINLSLVLTVSLMFADMPYLTIAACFGFGWAAFVLSRFVFKIYGRAWVIGALAASFGTFVTGLFYVNYYGVVTKLDNENVLVLDRPEDLFKAQGNNFFLLNQVLNKIEFAENHYAKIDGMKQHCVVYPIVSPEWKKEDTVRVWGAYITRSAFFERNSPELKDRTNMSYRMLWVYSDSAQLAAFREAIDNCAQKQGLITAKKIIVAEWADTEDEKRSLARKFWLAWALLNATWGVAVFVKELNEGKTEKQTP
jgi:hypothetical protein